MADTPIPTARFETLNDQQVPVLDGFIGLPSKQYAVPPKYTYARYLARGASGIAFEIVRNADKQVFALKATFLEKLTSADRLRQESEVACMRTVNHFACVGLSEFVMSDRVLFLVMEYCDGGDLAFQIQNIRMSRIRASEVVRGSHYPVVSSTGGGPSQCAGFDEDMLRYMLLQLLLGLHHMHTHCHMLHRDLKPHNVLTTTTGLLKIGDFGFSKSYNTMRDDVARTFCGTPGYMAPEVLQKKLYGRPADMWSLGVLIYECMTTTVPFYSQNLEQLRQSTLEDDPTPITVGNYSQELRQIVMSLLSKDPATRPDTSQLLHTPYARAALATFRDALCGCPIVDEVMTQAQAALQPAPVFRVDNTIHFEGPVRKLKGTTGEWVARFLILSGGELRLERARRRQASDLPGAGGSAIQSGRRSTESSRNSTFSNLVLPHAGTVSPNIELPLAVPITSSSTADARSPLGTQLHENSFNAASEDGVSFTPIISPQPQPQQDSAAHSTFHLQVVGSPLLSVGSPQFGGRTDLSSFKVTQIDDIQVLGDHALALRLYNNQFVFFETEQAGKWESALRQCLGWPARSPAA